MMGLVFKQVATSENAQDNSRDLTAATVTSCRFEEKQYVARDTITQALPSTESGPRASCCEVKQDDSRIQSCTLDKNLHDFLK